MITSIREVDVHAAARYNGRGRLEQDQAAGIVCFRLEF
jgi:hypothetical protein